MRNITVTICTNTLLYGLQMDGGQMDVNIY